MRIPAYYLEMDHSFKVGANVLFGVNEISLRVL